MKLEKSLLMRRNYLVAEVSLEGETQENLWNNTFRILLMIISTGWISDLLTIMSVLSNKMGTIMRNRNVNYLERWCLHVTAMLAIWISQGLACHLFKICIHRSESLINFQLTGKFVQESLKRTNLDNGEMLRVRVLSSILSLLIRKEPKFKLRSLERRLQRGLLQWLRRTRFIL